MSMSHFQLDLGVGRINDPTLLSTAIIEPTQMPQIKNVVATLNVNCRLDLKEIVTRSRNSEYNPKRFAAVIMRIREPKCTALIFSTGKMVITGGKNEESARQAARKFVRILQKLDFPAKLNDYKAVNIVGCVDVGFPIRLEALAISESEYSSYEPELFPGLIYRMNEPKVVILIFVSGKIVLTGAKSKDQINKAFKEIFKCLCKFKKHHQYNNDNDNDNDGMDIDNDNQPLSMQDIENEIDF